MRLNFQEEHPFFLHGFPPRLFPIIPVELIGPRGHSFKTLAQVDTGAEISMFNARFAHRIGIDYLTGTKEQFGGVDPKSSLLAYVHRIDMTIGRGKKIRCEPVS